MLIDRNEEGAKSVAAEIGSAAVAVGADVTDPDAVAAALDRAAGPLRGIVCCAGVGACTGFGPGGFGGSCGTGCRCDACGTGVLIGG